MTPAPSQGEIWWAEAADRSRPVLGRHAERGVGMCDLVEVAERVETPTLATRPLFVVQVPKEDPAEIAGIPLPDAVVEALRATASIEPVLVDDDGVPVTIGETHDGAVPQGRPGGVVARRALPDPWL